MAAPTISTQVKRCLELNTSLSDAVADTDIALPEGLPLSLEDQKNRFAVWCGNIGAHKTGTSSLEHRLRDASHIRENVISLLDELESLTNDAKAIITGEMTPWDQMPEEEGEADDIGPDPDEDLPGTEIEQIAMDIKEVVDSLLRLSITIRNPAPHDRFLMSGSTDTSHFEAFDIQHVKAKFENAGPWLTERLGKAISRRRQYFKYRQQHHDKLAYGMDGDDDRGVAPSTLASSIPEKLKKGNQGLLDDDNDSNADWVSQTSFATSVGGSEQLHVPPLPEEAEKGPFECPFCFMIVNITDRKAWKKHIFADLRPYVCLEQNCVNPDQEFSRRHEWLEHMKQSHWTSYTCPLGCQNPTFTSASQCKAHLDSAHHGKVQEHQVDALIKLHAELKTDNIIFECLLCNHKFSSLKPFRRHVGRHQEQLSLFALPSVDVEDGADRQDADLDSVSVGSGESETGDGHVNIFDFLVSTGLAPGEEMPMKLEGAPIRPDSEHTLDDANKPDERQRVETWRRFEESIKAESEADVESDEKDRDRDWPTWNEFLRRGLAAPPATDVEQTRLGGEPTELPGRTAQDDQHVESSPQASIVIPKSEEVDIETRSSALQTLSETEAAAKQSEIEARIRKAAEERIQERMEEMRKAEEEARKKIETARREAERAARERIEHERKVEEERQNRHSELMQQAEQNARRKFEAETEAAEEREKQEAELRERAEEDAKIRLLAALKAEAEAKAAAETKAAEEAARLKEIQEEAKRKAEAAAKVEKEKADAEAESRKERAQEAVKRYMQEEAERIAAKEKELEELQREHQRWRQEDLTNSGLDQDAIAAILQTKESKAPSDTAFAERPRPTYTRMARRHLSIETLRVFHIDYDYDADPEYLLIKRWVPEWEQDQLWNHTRTLRSRRGKQLIVEPQEQTDNSTFEWVRKKSKSRRKSKSPSLLRYLAGDRSRSGQGIDQDGDQNVD